MRRLLILLPISNFTIKIKPSNDFIRLLNIVHIAAGISILKSNFAGPIIFILLISLLFSLILCKKNHQSNLFNLEKLSYQNGNWQMNHLEKQYDSLKISFNAGIFLIIHLKNNAHSKRIYLFHDQITANQMNKIIIFSAITRPST